MKIEIPQDRRATEYLANERTFLAWIRTSISILSLGFVVARFGVWLRELAARIDPGAQARGPSYSMPIGVAMMALGSSLAVVAALHYRAVNKAIARGEVQANQRLVAAVAVAVALLGAVMITYMLSTASRL
jgi:putative membrane protein